MRHTYADRNSYTYVYSDRYSYPYAKRSIATDTDAHFNTYADSETYSDTAASPYSGATPLDR